MCTAHGDFHHWSRSTLRRTSRRLKEAVTYYSSTSGDADHLHHICMVSYGVQAKRLTFGGAERARVVIHVLERLERPRAFRVP